MWKTGNTSGTKRLSGCNPDKTGKLAAQCPIGAGYSRLKKKQQEEQRGITWQNKEDDNGKTFTKEYLDRERTT